ncbi:hypothetical protein HYALB_00009654 [Hymenoscyphus albidus]|uniref:Uncharacterized protein n=1 Tax=Hymenoscyphus albidus TaxID=595503 RepID=A0A9N9LI61_9HELO|nr:hypothetical protein HYALB_00009654 [Hymenoscyphus albidus]
MLLLFQKIVPYLRPQFYALPKKTINGSDIAHSLKLFALTTSRATAIRIETRTTAAALEIAQAVGDGTSPAILSTDEGSLVLAAAKLGLADVVCASIWIDALAGADEEG